MPCRQCRVAFALLLCALLALELPVPAGAGEAVAPPLPAGPACGDFLAMAGRRPDVLEFLGCEPGRDAQLPVLAARYRVRGADAALGALTGVDIAAEDVVRQRRGGLGAVGEDYLALRALLTDDVLVVLDVVHAGEGMADGAEDAAILGQREHVGIGVDAAVVHRILVKEVVADLVGGVGEHENDLLGAAGDAAQADGKAVAGENGEHDGDGLAAQLGAQLFSSSAFPLGLHACIIDIARNHPAERRRSS